MIIVAGHLRVDPDARSTFLDASHDVITAARAAPGCIDFHLAADPIEADRVNVFEQWNSAADVEAFRGNGPADERSQAILDASVAQYEVGATTPLT